MYSFNQPSNINHCFSIEYKHAYVYRYNVYVPYNTYIGEVESVVEPDIVQVAPQSGADNSANLNLTALTADEVSTSPARSTDLWCD